MSGVPDVYRLWRWQLSPVAGRLDDDRAIGSAGLLRGGTNRLSRGLAARDDHDSGGHRVEVDDSHHGALHRTDSRRDVWAACPLSSSTSAVCRLAAGWK